MNYADNLRRYRQSLGLNQDEMAKILELKNQQAYQYYEAGNLNARKAKQFSVKLGFDLTVDHYSAALPVILKYLSKLVAKDEKKNEAEVLQRIMDEIKAL